ncbi:MAG: class I SAM-dependent methyltransferase [Pseudolabrys sp.]
MRASPISAAAPACLLTCCASAVIARAGIDISSKLLEVGRQKYPELELIEGDIEHLPFADGELDGVLLSGVIHHFPDPRRTIAEVQRVLRLGGRFMAFDPNRRNPFMYLYRDRSSPF